MARRPKGTGSLRLRGSVWYARYTLRGLPVETCTGETDREKAQKYLTQRQAEAASADISRVPAERLTVGQLCELVLADHDVRRTASAKGLRWSYEKHTKDTLGNINARRLTTQQIRAYITGRRKAGASDATINRELSTVRRGFKLAEQDGSSLRAPYIPMLAEDNARQGYLTPDGYRNLLEKLPPRLMLIFVVGYHTGARKGELRKIRCGQVDLEAGVIRVAAATTKAKKARVLPIWGDMTVWLTRELQSAPDAQRWLFWHKGRRLGAHLAGWAEACTAAGLPGLLFHDLRRSAVRLMNMAGLSDTDAMQISGHLTREMYERYSIHDEVRATDSGRKLEAFFAVPKVKLKRVK